MRKLEKIKRRILLKIKKMNDSTAEQTLVSGISPAATRWSIPGLRGGHEAVFVKQNIALRN